MLRIVEGPLWVLIEMIICAWSHRTGLGAFTEPGVGFVAFAAVAIGALVTVFRRPEEQKSARVPAAAHARFLESAPFKLTYTLLLLVIYALLLNHMGYLITTFLVLFGLFFDPVGRRAAGPLLASFLCVTVAYLSF